MSGIFAINSVLCSAVASLSASRKHSRIATRESGTRNHSLRSITAQKQADIPAMKSNRLDLICGKRKLEREKLLQKTNGLSEDDDSNFRSGACRGIQGFAYHSW